MLPCLSVTIATTSGTLAGPVTAAARIASAAAEKLYTHRNTVERRLARVDQLLPAPLADNAASVVAALMLVQLRD